MAGPRDFTHTFAVAGTQRFNVAGRYLHVVRAPTAALFVSLDDGSELERVAGEGLYVGEGFKIFEVRSPVAQTVRLMVADEPQVTGGGAGSTAAMPTTIQEAPSDTISSLADNALAAATTEAIAANDSRRRITVGCLSSNTVGFRVRASGAPALSGIEVVPGTFVEIKTKAALEIRNDSGATATSYYIFEET